MGDFDFKPSVDPMAFANAGQRKFQIEQQARESNQQQLVQGLTTIGTIGQSLFDKKKDIAQALAAGKVLDIDPDTSRSLGSAENVIKAFGAKKGYTNADSFLQGIRLQLSGAGIGAPGAATPGAQPAVATPSAAPAGQPAGGPILASNVTATPVDAGATPAPAPAPASVPVPIAAPPAKPRMISPAEQKILQHTADVAIKQAAANKPENVLQYVPGKGLVNVGTKQKGDQVITSQPRQGQDIMDPKYQGKLETQYQNMKMKALSNRSGGLGLEDGKVNQAIHLRKAVNQYYDPKTGEYNIPPSLHSEFVLGLAKLMSQNGTVAQQTMDELRQRTAREGAANVLISMGFDPKEVGGTTQSVAKFFVEQIDRQGQTAEENRNGYMDYIHGQAPSDLDPARIAKHDKTGLNSFTDILAKSPDHQASSGHPPGWDESKEQKLQMLRAKKANGTLRS